MKNFRFFTLFNEKATGHNSKHSTTIKSYKFRSGNHSITTTIKEPSLRSQSEISAPNRAALVILTPPDFAPWASAPLEAPKAFVSVPGGARPYRAGHAPSTPRFRWTGGRVRNLAHIPYKNPYRLQPPSFCLTTCQLRAVELLGCGVCCFFRVVVVCAAGLSGRDGQCRVSWGFFFGSGQRSSWLFIYGRYV